MERAYLTEMLEVLVGKMAKEDEAALIALKLRYGLPVTQRRVTGTLGMRFGLMLVAAGFGAVAPFLMMIVYFTVLQIWTLLDILQHPTISLKVSVLVTMFVVCVDLYACFSPTVRGVKFVSDEETSTAKSKGTD